MNHRLVFARVQSPVLLAAVGPEHTLNLNSNLVQYMFIVTSEYVPCHTSFTLCSDFKEKIGHRKTSGGIWPWGLSSLELCLRTSQLGP